MNPSTHFVKDMVVSLAGTLVNDARLFEQVVVNNSTMDGTNRINLQLNVLPKARRIVIADLNNDQTMHSVETTIDTKRVTVLAFPNDSRIGLVSMMRSLIDEWFWALAARNLRASLVACQRKKTQN